MTPLDLHPIRFRQLGAWQILVELASGDEAFSPEPGPEADIAARQQRSRSHRPAEGPQRVGRGFCPRRETERSARPFHPPCAGVPGLPPSSRHLGERGLLAGGTGPVEALGVDLLALSAHKLYGPKGAGALYVRRGVALAPLLGGGHQERGLRPGTENVAGAVGLGAAARLGRGEGLAAAPRVAALRDRLEAGLLAVAGARRHGDPAAR